MFKLYQITYWTENLAFHGVILSAINVEMAKEMADKHTEDMEWRKYVIKRSVKRISWDEIRGIENL